MDIGSLLAVLLLGLVAGAIARALVPGDAFRHMSGPRSWLVSIVMGLLGSLLGYWFFSLIGIGDTDKFDWGGIIGAVIGAIVVVAVTSTVVKRMATKNDPPGTIAAPAGVSTAVPGSEDSRPPSGGPSGPVQGESPSTPGV